LQDKFPPPTTKYSNGWRKRLRYDPTPGRESFLNRGVSGIDGKADLFDLARAYTSAELSLHRSGVDEESDRLVKASSTRLLNRRRLSPSYGMHFNPC